MGERAAAEGGAAGRAAAGAGPHRVAGPLVLAGEEQTVALGRRLAGLLRAGDLVVLAGPLGAGKTTLTRGLGEGLRVRGAVTSPTFVLARVHPSLAGGPALVHVDAYRLASAAEVEDLDLEESLADAVTVVEWGTGKVEALSDDRLEVRLEPARPPGADEGTDDGPDARRATVAGVGARWAGVRLPAGDLPAGGPPAGQAEAPGQAEEGTD